MAATHDAICKHGYADLSMRNIAAECSKSHSLLTYHYDTKANLIEAYLDYLVAYLEQYAEPDSSIHPLDRVEHYLDYFTVGSDHVPHALQVAFLELQMVALRDDDFQEKLGDHRRQNVQLLTDIVEDGVDRGVFRSDLDVDAVAKLILSSAFGASSWETTNGQPGLTDDVRDALRAEVFPHLLADDAPERDTPRGHHDD